MTSQFWSFQRRFILSIGLAMLWLFLASLWVPISMEPVGYYREANLFIELRPRALTNTVASLFNLTNWGFNALKIGALFIWLFLILMSFGKQLLTDGVKPTKYSVLNYVALSFIFAWSTVTFMTYAPVAILDSIPYCLMLIAVIICQTHSNTSLASSIIVACFILLAVSAHEKSIFDLAILGIWFSWKWGLRRSFRYFLPTLISCGLFLWAVQNKETSGLSTASYLGILKSGFDFMMANSYNLTAILFGGGALWVLYAGASYRFITLGADSLNRIKRGMVCLALLLLCLAPLLVSWDTNRLVDLIWLPIFLVMSELSSSLNSKKTKFLTVILLILCLLQVLIPPLLRTNDLVFAFNAYAAPYAKKFKNENFSKESLIPAGEVLLFSKDGLGGRTLADGWNDQEPWGIWSKENGKLNFNNLGAGIQAIQVSAKALITPSHPTQSLTVLLNQKPVQTVTLRNSDRNTFEITLSAKTKPGEPLQLEFQVINPITPIEAGISSNDNRILGIGLMRLDFKEAVVKP